jgi:formylglycine-generating enzyme required for sulfatase activity
VGILLCLPTGSRADDPDWYLRRQTWWQTARASLDAFTRQPARPAAADFEPFTSDVLRGGQAARHVRLRVAGLGQIVLSAKGVPNYNSAHADWGDARLIAADGSVTYLSDLKPVRIHQPYGTPRFDKSHRGGPIRIGGQEFERGLGTHAPTELVFALDGEHEWLEAWIGIDATAGKNGHVEFSITDTSGDPLEAFRDELWRLVERDFGPSREMTWEREDGLWQRPADAATLAGRYAEAARRVPAVAQQAARLAAGVGDEQGLAAVRELYLKSRRLDEAKTLLGGLNLEALRLAIADLTETFGPEYPKGEEYLARLDGLEQSLQATLKEPARDDDDLIQRVEALTALRREALLANPLLDFDRLLVVKRRPIREGRPADPDTSFGFDMGLPRSSHGNSSLPQKAFDNEIAVISPVAPNGRLATLFKPEAGRFVGDVDLHFNADRLLFSMRDDRGLFQIHQIGADGSGLCQVSRGDQPDVDNYDPCYLPDGRIVFASSACFQGVPCNKSHVAVLYRMEADGTGVRQLAFEQDHDFNPSVLPSGRVLYTRWEYSDLPHANSRMMFSMNPDGTNQAAYYGSSSYWPNSIFGARPVPGRPGKFVGVVAGHHGSFREGELVLFDVGRGRHEAGGAVQRIPGRGREVEPIVRDELTAASWPKLAHPYPLSEKHFLVTCKLDESAPWDVYLVDVFDNLLRLYHAEGYALFEPIPLRPAKKPPALPDRVDPSRNDAVVYLSDVYSGPGLAGVPRGTVKQLRLYTLHFAYRGMGGLLGTVGLDGPWDIRRVLGTVPIEADGSALFRVPANTPVSVQPLDAEGKALQHMRSWFVGMPGERVSCVGCHDHQSTTPVNLDTLAARRNPSPIAPWIHADRNLSFKRDVQPVVDRHCVGCHDGQPAAEGAALPDLRRAPLASDYRSDIAGNGGGPGGRYFSVGYLELARRVRRPGIESDLHMLPPLEFHADTTQLVQMLQKGHYGVELDDEAWRRLITWIDMNAPYHGTWTEIGWDPGPQRQRRRALRRLYAGVDEDPESLAEVPAPEVEPIVPTAPEPDVPADRPSAAGWPFGPAEAARRQAAAGRPVTRRVELGDGVTLHLALIPPGEFVMGDPRGEADERPLAGVRIERAFWMGTHEVTNRQFARFDPGHDSRFESKNGYQFGVTGFELNRPGQPVVRVSWSSAVAFCRWLSEQTGEPFTLPTEAQWEYACRAGSEGAFFFGDGEADFSPFANVADVKLRQFATDPYTIYQAIPNPTKYDDWIPRDRRFDDDALVTADVGRYRPNPWGLFDVHGNVAEWTRSAYRPYPYDAGDGRDGSDASTKKAVRGGSWRDRPKRCRSAFRLAYRPWQGVYNVGFRVVCQPSGF